MSVAIPGKHFGRALSYALKATPADDASARMAHLVLHKNRIIASDGRRMHIGFLPKEAALSQPYAVTKESMEALELALKFTLRASKMRGTSFHVELQSVPSHIVGDPPGLKAVIVYGAEYPIALPLARCPVGYIPDEWEEWVKADATPTSQLSDFDCQHTKEALEWYRSWGKDHGSFTWRLADGIARLDIVSGGDLVAAAFIIPESRPDAQLVHDEPLFQKLNPGRKVGQSILDLQLDGDGAPAKKLDVLDINGHEINVRGLEDPEQYIKEGPCVHGVAKGEPCWQDTQEAVKEAKAAKRKNKKKPEPNGESEATT